MNIMYIFELTNMRSTQKKSVSVSERKIMHMNMNMSHLFSM
jgi:hypothetical protein